MSFKKKIFWLTMMLVLALVGGALHPGKASAAALQGTITVVGENGSTLLPETPVEFTDNETAFDALVSQVGSDNVKYTQYSFGKMINSINNLAGTSDYKKYWGFYIDGITAQVGPDSYTVQNGDHLIFRYVDTTQPQTTATLKVVGNNNSVLHDFSGNISIGFTGQPTALQLLEVTLGSSKVGIKDTQYGPMITSIDDLAAQGNSYWAFSINGNMASVGAADYHLKPNDQITFQYETYVPSSGGSGDTSSTATAPAKISGNVLQNAIDKASIYTIKNGINDWGAIALKQAGKSIPSSYLAGVASDIQNKSGKFHYITDSAKYTLGILAAGGNPTNIEGFNIVGSIYNGDAMKQGLNGAAFALIALDSANFTIPTTAIWTKEKLINTLLAAQLADGGWSYSTTAKTGDPDMTAMVLIALAPYKDQAGVKEKVANAVQYLQTQNTAAKINNSETSAYVIIALSALGIDANGSAFSKDNVSLMQSLLKYQNADGGFASNIGGASDNAFATPEGFEALVAYQLYVNGKGPLYHLPLTAHQPIISQAKAVNQGHLLPETATNAVNFVVLGVLLIMMGMVVYFWQYRRKV